MGDAMEWLKNNLVEFLLLFIPSTFVVVKWLLPKILDGMIQQKLERCKYELSKLEYNFKLYTEKQHEVFLKFHQLYGEAKARVLSLAEFQFKPDFSSYEREDILKLLDNKELNILEGQKKKILDYFDSGYKSGAVNELNNLITDIDNNLAQNSIYIAHNFALENQLYIPDEIFNLSQDLYEELYKFKLLYAVQRKARDEKIEDYLNGLKESREKIENLYIEITKKLKEHMQKGSLNE